MSAASAGETALVDAATAWRNPRVEICFGLAETEIAKRSSLVGDLRRVGTVVEKSPYEKIVRGLVEREYTARMTGVHFTGWKTCRGITRETPNAPAFIFADTDLKWFGVATVGDEDLETPREERLGMVSGTILNLRKVADTRGYSVERSAKALREVAPAGERAEITRIAKEIDRKLVRDLVDNTILHEVGHVAGLQHEEKRTDYPTGQPEWCRDASDSNDQEADERTYGTEFDPFAVTNYCADDIAKGFALFHLFCEFPRASAALEKAEPIFEFSKFRNHCERMLERSYLARLSTRDRAALRRLYLGVPVPAGSRTYRTNPEELQIVKALSALYESLPKDMNHSGADALRVRNSRWMSH